VAKLLQPRRGPGDSSDTLFIARPAGGVAMEQEEM